MTEKTYEMMWDCDYCGTKKLLGKTHRFCAECGAPQNPEKRYFPPENEKVAVEDHQFVGADIHCPACQEPQSASVKHCANCGSPLQGGKAASAQAGRMIGADGQVEQPPAPGTEKKSKAGLIIGIIVGVVVLIIVLIVVNKFMTKDAALEVTKLTWERSITVETYKKVKDTGDCSKLPEGAKVTKKKKGKEVCKKKQTDQGDGTFKEKKVCKKEPDQCDYEATTWKVTDTLKEKGGVDDEPTWPETKGLKKKKKKKAKIGDKAEGTRTESYIVHFKEAKGGDTHTCSFSDVKKWKSFEKGDKYKGETGMIGGDLKCDKLEKK